MQEFSMHANICKAFLCRMANICRIILSKCTFYIFFYALGGIVTKFIALGSCKLFYTTL